MSQPTPESWRTHIQKERPEESGRLINELAGPDYLRSAARPSPPRGAVLALGILLVIFAAFLVQVIVDLIIGLVRM